MIKLNFGLLFAMTTCFFRVCSITTSSPVASPNSNGSLLTWDLLIPRDYANPGTSGIIALDYNVFFSSDQYYDHNGNEVEQLDFGLGYGPIPIDIEMSGYINALALGICFPGDILV